MVPSCMEGLLLFLIFTHLVFINNFRGRTNISKPLHIIGVYHPPPNSENNTTNGMFIDDIMELLVANLPQYQNTIVLGDFNMHIEHVTNSDAVIFNDTMRALGLKQHLGPNTCQRKHPRPDFHTAKQQLHYL